MRLLQDELVYAEPLPVDAMGFTISDTDRRVFPYLFAGSAGYADVLSRYLVDRPDAEFDSDGDPSPAEVLERCLQACSVRFTVFPDCSLGWLGCAWSWLEPEDG